MEITFEEMKPTLQEWMVDKSYSLVKKVEEIDAQNKADAYKQLHMLFYLGSMGDNFVPEFR